MRCSDAVQLYQSGFESDTQAMTFISRFESKSEPMPSDLCFAYHDEKLLVTQRRDIYGIPRFKDLGKQNKSLSWKHYLGTLNGQSCYAAEWNDPGLCSGEFLFMGLRALFGLIDEDLIWAAGSANHMIHWHQTHRHCGKCGRPTKNKPDERAKICPECGLINYPRVSPAVIVAVLKDNAILLGRSHRFPLPFYSVLAGFVEPGETLEECVQRELMEEVGILLKNIRYFGSQPWPFPNSLMVAFTAEYADGEIKVDKSELVDAGWYTTQNMPLLPSSFSIARQLITWFVENHSPEA
jgi:NAD+ diphosphatase